jgi:flagellar biosynthesis anti-sigma factor FlgM
MEVPNAERNGTEVFSGKRAEEIRPDGQPMTYPSAIETGGFPNDLSISSAAAAAIPATARATQRTATAASQAIDSIASDSAKVSLAGAMLSQASTGSDVRFDKVAALQQSIQAGTYGVPAANVAGKLIEALQK